MWHRVRLRGYRKVLYSTSDRAPDAHEVVERILDAEEALARRRCDSAYIEERDWPRHWHEELRSALARVAMAAKVLYLARLYGVEGEGLPKVEGARRVLAGAEARLPRALVANLRRERETSDFRQRYMRARRVLLAEVHRDEIFAAETELRYQSGRLERLERQIEQVERLVESQSQAQARRYEEELSRLVKRASPQEAAALTVTPTHD